MSKKESVTEVTGRILNAFMDRHIPEYKKERVTPYFQYGLPLSYYAKGKSIHMRIPGYDTGRTLEGECEKS